MIETLEKKSSPFVLASSFWACPKDLKGKLGKSHHCLKISLMRSTCMCAD